jgi:hypothetical protein
VNAFYVSIGDPRNPNTWSGVTFWASSGLVSAGFDLDLIGPLVNRYRLFTSIKGRIINKLGWKYSPYGEHCVLKSFAKQVEEGLKSSNGKVIISCGRPHLAYLRTKLPFVFFDDGSTPAMIQSFPSMMHLWPSNLRGLYRAERMVLEKCLFACYASDWAAEGALQHYGHSFANKIRVVPWGANMEVHRNRAEVAAIVKKRCSDVCRLLFVGAYRRISSGRDESSGNCSSTQNSWL